MRLVSQVDGVLTIETEDLSLPQNVAIHAKALPVGLSQIKMHIVPFNIPVRPSVRNNLKTAE
jgi:uncharacterized protein YwlG (UPF0340 family)